MCHPVLLYNLKEERISFFPLQIIVAPEKSLGRNRLSYFQPFTKIFIVITAQAYITVENTVRDLYSIYYYFLLHETIG